MEALLKNFDLVPLDALMILVTVVLFVIFWKCFARVFVAPFVQLVEERERATEGQRDSAHELSRKADTLEQQYEEQINQARVAAMKEQLQELATAKQKVQQIIEAAEQKAAAETKTARQQAAQKLDTVRARVMGDAESMADMVVQRLLEPRTQQTRQ